MTFPISKISSPISLNRPRRRFFVTAAFLTFLLAAAPAWSAVLGDPAPALRVSKWLKGDPLDPSKSGKPTVVEFWSINCPHCLKSLPLLTSLQEAHKEKGLTVLGIAKDSSEDVENFLKTAEEGPSINYSIAVDDHSMTQNAFMDAFGVEGVPHAFLVDKEGRIVWEGHPLNGLEKAVTALMAGTYDLRAAVEEDTAEVLLENYMYLSARTREKDLIQLVGERIMSKAANDMRVLNRLARLIVIDPRISQPDTDMAIKAIERAYALSGGQQPQVLETYAKVLLRAGKVKEAADRLGELKTLVDRLEKEGKKPSAEEDGAEN